MELFMDNLRNALFKGKVSDAKVKSLVNGRLLVQGAATAGLAFLMGRIAGFCPQLPCAIALMTALMYRGKGNIYALPLLILGLFSELGTGYLFWLQAAASTACTLLFFLLQKRKLSLPVRALTAGGVLVAIKTACFLWVGRFFLYDALTAAVELILLFALVYLFYSFLRMLDEGGQPGVSETEAIAVFTAVLMLSVIGIGVNEGAPFSLPIFFALLVTLFMGHRIGSMEGGLAGVTAGVLFMAASQGTPALAGVLGFCGIAAGFFQKQSRFLTGICFAAAAVLFGLLQGYPDLYFSVYEPLAAGACFALIPSGAQAALCRWFPISVKAREEYEWTEKKRARRILKGYRDVFEKLALCCGVPQYNNPAKEVMSLQFKGLTKILDELLTELTNPVKPKLQRRAHYQLSLGVSSYAKEKGVSGDSYICERLDEGEFLMALSDGMGKGLRASEESSLTVNALRDLLKAGFDVEVALRIINSVLLLKSTDEIFSTVDMGLFNLFTGKMRLFKIGAAATFIKRDGQVRAIKISALPIGIVDRIPIDSVEIKARRGDEIIIVSDGITEAARGEGDLEWLEGAILGIRSKDPQTMADLIINKAVERYGLKEKDDMTVIVASVA